MNCCSASFTRSNGYLPISALALLPNSCSHYELRARRDHHGIEAFSINRPVGEGNTSLVVFQLSTTTKLRLALRLFFAQREEILL
jgi:hypothetical protein